MLALFRDITATEGFVALSVWLKATVPDINSGYWQGALADNKLNFTSSKEFVHVHLPTDGGRHCPWLYYSVGLYLTS